MTEITIQKIDNENYKEIVVIENIIKKADLLNAISYFESEKLKIQNSIDDLTKQLDNFKS